MTLKKRSPELLFRSVSWLARLRLDYRVRSVRNPRWLLLVFAVVAGCGAFTVITTVALVTSLPLIFPPLGATAFILFNSPLSPAASPRCAILSHTTGLLAGLLAVSLVAWLWPGFEPTQPGVLNWARVVTIAVSMVITSASMIGFRFAHPPAMATTLIVAMGYVSTVFHVAGFCIAVLLLVVEAYLVHRILAGIPYPPWRHDSEVAREYRALTDEVDSQTGVWDKAADRLFQKR